MSAIVIDETVIDTVVIDASVLVVALADDGNNGDAARTRLRDYDLIAPEIIDLEVLSVLRRLVTTRKVTARRAKLAIDDLIALPITRAPHRGLLNRCWELKHNLTPYDAAYVATAEGLGVPLLTADARLSRSPGVRCRIDLLA